MKTFIYLFIFSSIAFCQNNINRNTLPKESLVEKTRYTGYRLGTITYSKLFRDFLENDWDSPSTLVQVGWETKSIIYPTDNSPKAFTKSMCLIAGLEHGLFLPQFNWQMGLITKNNLEIGIGPYLTFIGTALILSVENRKGSGVLTYPVSIGIAIQKNEFALSLLVGFETPN